MSDLVLSQTYYLWLISQNANKGYDTYDSAVVVAESEEAARAIYPGGGPTPTGNYCWTSAENVTARLLGVAADSLDPGVICASFNAG